MNFQPYSTRPVRFVEIHLHKDWKIKVYSISIKNETVSQENIDTAKQNLDHWLSGSKITGLKNYKIATLILHEGKGGCFAIINWWVDENMLQNFVYLKQDSSNYKIISDKGIITCVWEMAVLWYERCSWVRHVLKNPEAPNFTAYLNDQLNDDV